MYRNLRNWLGLNLRNDWKIAVAVYVTTGKHFWCDGVVGRS